ncbi:MAG: zf-HC2 domain-containing protein [Planctomycetota bacterium]
MMNECDAIRPLLFEAIEEELTGSDRQRVTTHLAICEDCRRELAEERALTELLRRPRPAPSRFPLLRSPLVRRVAALLVMGLCLFAVARVFNNSTAYGSIEPSTLSLTMTFEDGRVAPLESQNHLVIPFDSVTVLKVLGTASIRVPGPAVLDLDRTTVGWKLALLRGRIQATIEESASLTVTSAFGMRVLEPGQHLLASDAASFSQDDPGQDAPSPDQLFKLGLDEFFDYERMEQAESYFRAILARDDAGEAVRSQALFYLAASLGRQKKYAEAIEIQARWLQQNPHDDSRHHVLFFQGLYHQYLGHAQEAQECWQIIADEDPESALLERVSSAKAAPPAGEAEEPPADHEAAAIHSVPRFAAQPAGKYLVVTLDVGTTREDHLAFRRVADEVSKFHGGVTEHHTTRDLASLERSLAGGMPEFVLFVVPPDILDVNLHRRLLLLSARLDQDPLPDFAFGYFTGKDGAALERLWQRTRKLHEEGLPNRHWMSAFVTSGSRSFSYEDGVDAQGRAAGFSGPSFAFATAEDDPDCMEFVRKSLPTLETASVLTFTGNGDPQGIWLFDDQRNMDSGKHWKFSPELVGNDPKGEMPRIMAAQFATLHLHSPIIWSGTCHSAATRRVFVEGDIVSTFGRTDRTTAYDLDPDESLCLAMLQAGAVAFLAPIGGNHGFSVDLETEFALREGAPLGNAIKSTYDDVFLAAGGSLVLDLVEAGQPQVSTGAVMQGGGANRVLIGDPSLSPFQATARPGEELEIRRTRNGFEVVLDWDEGFHAREWDIYGISGHDGRVFERIRVDGLLAEGASFEVDVTVVAGDGEPLPYHLSRVEIEQFHGRRYLHLQANADRKLVQDQAKKATFRVEIQGCGPGD